MSVDQAISELSQTLAQLGTLVGHINGQINGITSRINVTLDNFDNAVANIAKDAGSVTYQVGDTVSQVPNSWVFYLLFITLIVVFILLSVVLILNLITKAHAIYSIMKASPDSTERALLSSRDSQLDYSGGAKSTPINAVSTPYSQQTQFYPSRNHQNTPNTPQHVSIQMDNEPRRLGRRESDNGSSLQSVVQEVRPYPRRQAEPTGAKYNLETGTAASYHPRSLEV